MGVPIIKQSDGDWLEVINSEGLPGYYRLENDRTYRTTPSNDTNYPYGFLGGNYYRTITPEFRKKSSYDKEFVITAPTQSPMNLELDIKASPESIAYLQATGKINFGKAASEDKAILKLQSRFELAKPSIDMFLGRNYNPFVDQALNKMGNTWFLNPQDYIYKGYFKSNTHNNVREGGNMAARALVNTVALPLAFSGAANGAKGLWDFGKMLFDAYRINPLWGAYNTVKLAVPITAGTFAGLKGLKLVDEGMINFNGKTWAQNMSGMSGYPEWLMEFTNPGAAAGGYAGFKATNGYFGGATKRAAEMSMKVTNVSNPMPKIKKGLKWMWEHPFDPTTLKRLRYFFTGYKGNLPYNKLSFSNPDDGLYYDGTYSTGLEDGTPIDLAVGKSKTPNSKIGKLADDNDTGALTDYIEEHSLYKDAKIIDVDDVSVIKGATPEEVSRGYKTVDKPMVTKEGIAIDTAGHRIQFRRNPTTGELEYREMDLWKFDANDFWRKYNGDKLPYDFDNLSPQELEKALIAAINENWENRLYDLGLRIVDSNITPYIYRGLWHPVSKQPVSKQPVSKQPVSKQPVSKQPAIELKSIDWSELLKGLTTTK